MTNDLLARLPHKPPALLLADVIEVSDAHVRCALAREAGDPPSASMAAALALEAMAQAAAVWMIGRAGPGAGGPGMLVSCRDLVMRQRDLDLTPGLVAEARFLNESPATGLSEFFGSVGSAAEPDLVTATFSILAAPREA